MSEDLANNELLDSLTSNVKQMVINRGHENCDVSYDDTCTIFVSFITDPLLKLAEFRKSLQTISYLSNFFTETFRSELEFSTNFQHKCGISTLVLIPNSYREDDEEDEEDYF